MTRSLLQDKSSARPARGAFSPSRTLAPCPTQPFGAASIKRPPRGGAGRALDGGAVRVLCPEVMP